MYWMFGLLPAATESGGSGTGENMMFFLVAYLLLWLLLFVYLFYLHREIHSVEEELDAFPDESDTYEVD